MIWWNPSAVIVERHGASVGRRVCTGRSYEYLNNRAAAPRRYMPISEYMGATAKDEYICASFLRNGLCVMTKINQKTY